jgi:transcriptional regulator with XRE-family HTH domain
MEKDMIKQDTIARRIRLLMADRRLSQQQVAKAAGIGVGTVNRIYNGTEPNITLRSLMAICGALEITLAELVMPPGYDIIEAPERERAGVVQWCNAPLGRRFPHTEISQPADINAIVVSHQLSETTPMLGGADGSTANIELALNNHRKNRRRKSL